MATAVDDNEKSLAFALSLSYRHSLNSNPSPSHIPTLIPRHILTRIFWKSSASRGEGVLSFVCIHFCHSFFFFFFQFFQIFFLNLFIFSILHVCFLLHCYILSICSVFVVFFLFLKRFSFFCSLILWFFDSSFVFWIFNQKLCGFHIWTQVFSFLVLNFFLALFFFSFSLLVFSLF